MAGELESSPASLLPEVPEGLATFDERLGSSQVAVYVSLSRPNRTSRKSTSEVVHRRLHIVAAIVEPFDRNRNRNRNGVPTVNAITLTRRSVSVAARPGTKTRGA